MGIGRMLTESAREVVRLQVGGSNDWIDYEIVPIDRAVVLTAQRTTAFALYEVTKSLGKPGAPASLSVPNKEQIKEMGREELEQTLGNMMHMWRQIDPGTIKEGAAQIAAIVCQGVRGARAWEKEEHLVSEDDTLVPRVGPYDDDPEVPFEPLQVTTQERLQDPEQSVFWINSLPPSHIKKLHDAIFALSSEDASRIARFR